MSSSENKMLVLMAQKLGLEDDLQLVKKGHELSRLLEMKSLGNSSIILNDYAKSVICLDLASTNLGITFDAETALKLSGLKKNQYLNNLRTIEKLLDLARPLTINELCVQLGVTGVTEKAVALFDIFTKTHNTSDTSHPQYIAMTVFQACRLDNVKITRSKVIAFSRLKPSQWSVLETDWTKWVDTVASTLSKSINKKNAGSSIAAKCKSAEILTKQRSIEDEEAITEDYETWKKRILEAAYKDIQC